MDRVDTGWAPVAWCLTPLRIAERVVQAQVVINKLAGHCLAICTSSPAPLHTLHGVEARCASMAGPRSVQSGPADACASRMWMPSRSSRPCSSGEHAHHLAPPGGAKVCAAWQLVSHIARPLCPHIIGLTWRPRWAAVSWHAVQALRLFRLHGRCAGVQRPLPGPLSPLCHTYAPAPAHALL